jgi:hypothetical protein
MTQIAAKMNDREIKRVSDYIVVFQVEFNLTYFQGTARVLHSNRAAVPSVVWTAFFFLTSIFSLLHVSTDGIELAKVPRCGVHL